ncbi:hypothetical protein MAR_014467 [Mya arenaria]|uniref:Uncharacterized protein n=1 Tax=Mya arenaria TaxID=6604 RepID=A0ABY7G6F6_MYAAR|nr:hypothetical protein MAR_014467 [Mya arenaria]
MKISAIAVIALMGVLGAALADYGYGSDYGSSYGGGLGGAGYGYSYMPYYGGAGGAGGAGDGGILMLIGLLFVVVLLFSNNSFFNSTSGSTVTPITIVQDLQSTPAIHFHISICPIHSFKDDTNLAVLKALETETGYRSGKGQMTRSIVQIVKLEGENMERLLSSSQMSTPRLIAISKEEKIVNMAIVCDTILQSPGYSGHSRGHADNAGTTTAGGIQARFVCEWDVYREAMQDAMTLMYWLVEDESPNNIKFESLVATIKGLRLDILKMLCQGENAKYTSNDFINKTVVMFWNVILRNIIDDVKQSPLYSVMINKTTDIATHSQLVIYIHYLHPAKSRTVFCSKS